MNGLLAKYFKLLFFAKIGLTGTPKLKHEHKTNHKPYWEYYNDVDIMVVHEAYKRDIAMYNYEFGEENDKI